MFKITYLEGGLKGGPPFEIKKCEKKFVICQ